MLISKIDSLLEETATKTGYSQEIVADVIKHFFSYMKNFLLNPSHVGFRVTFLGVFRPDKKALNFYLRRLIKYLRKDRTNEENLQQFRKYWKLRRLLRDDTKRRNFKKRYGTWHFK